MKYPTLVLYVLIVLLAGLAGCALTPPAPTAGTTPSPILPGPIAIPTAPMPAGVPTAIAKAAPIVAGVADVVNSGDLSTAVDRGVTHAIQADPGHATEIYLGGMAAMTVLGILGKILDHKKVTTAITTPGTTTAKG